MKKLLLVAMATTCLWTTSHAQVGINTTDPEAILDVESDDSGILIPRVALTAANVAAPITTPTISELIYNTETAGSGVNAVTPGYYYWNGTVWVRLNAGTDATTNWSLTGNAGTNPATNFVGTTDGQSLAFRTNNAERMRILDNGRIGINTINPNYRFEVSDAGNSIGNTALGQFTIIGNSGVALAGNIESTENGHNAIEGINAYSGTMYNPSGVFGLFISSAVSPLYRRGIGTKGHSNSWQGVGVQGSRTNSGGPDNGFGGLFLGGLGYTTGFYGVSDEKLKKDINIITNGLEIVKSLNAVSYHYNTDRYPYLGLSSELEYGFIAQEVFEVLPNIVVQKLLPINGTKTKKANSIEESESELFYMLDYTRIIPILTKAIQEQQEIIENQEARIAKLEVLVQQLLEK